MESVEQGEEVIPDGVLTFPSLVDSILTYRKLDDSSAILIEEVITSLATAGDAQTTIAVDIENAFAWNIESVLLTGLIQRSYIVDRSGRNIGLSTDTPFENAESDKVPEQFIFDSILAELPARAIKVGDSWPLQAVCYPLGYKNSDGFRIISRDSEVRASSLYVNSVGKRVLVLDYTFVETISSQAKSAKDEKICRYTGKHEFNIDEGRWEKIDGLITYPAFEKFKMLSKTYRVELRLSDQLPPDGFYIFEPEAKLRISGQPSILKWPFDKLSYEFSDKILFQEALLNQHPNARILERMLDAAALEQSSGKAKQ